VTEIGFYHLTRSGIETALPQLLGRTLAAGQRALVLCRTEEWVAALDAALWACVDPDWLPHGTEKDGDAELQPIWLSTQDAAPNGARVLFLIDGAETVRTEQFERVFDLFDGNDEQAVVAARGRWSAARAAGLALTYWQQAGHGWEKKSGG
jgi:DNA polymerase-3 subunit chi